MEGWIHLHRKLLNNCISNKPEYLALWITLLLMASHKDGYSFILNNKKIELKKGQLLTGRKKLAIQTGIHESNVFRILKYLENEHQIEQQKTSKYTIITILNWEKYNDIEQLKEQQMNNKRTTNEQQMNTYKNVKNVEKVENKNIITPVGTGEYEKFIETFNRITNRKFTVRDKKARTQFLIRLKEGWKVEEIEGAIRSCMSDKFHKESGLKYLTPEFITRPDKLEKYAALSSPSSGLSPRSVEEMRKIING